MTDQWKSVADEMPDDEITVLVHAPESDEPVWLGYRDFDVWYYEDSQAIPFKVTHWRHLPAPPESK